jgi:hypothetical protein
MLSFIYTSADKKIQKLAALRDVFPNGNILPGEGEMG